MSPSDNGDSTASALTGGYDLAFVIGAGLVLAAITVALSLLRSGSQVEEKGEGEQELAAPEPAYSEAA